MKVKSLSPVRLLATPWTAAHQAPPSMGFSRQEYWSGVPLPSPLYLLECAKSLQLCPTLCDPRLFCPWDSPGKNTEWAPCPPPWDLPDPAIKPKCLTSFALAGRFFTTRPPEKIIKKDNEDLEQLEPSYSVGGNIKQ